MAVSAKRNARIELTASSSGMDQGLSDARRKMRTFEREQARSAKQQAKQQERDAKQRSKARGDFVRGVGQAAGESAFGIGKEAISDTLDFERNLTRFQILAGKTPEEMGALRSSILGVSNATGIAAKEVLSGAQTYVDLTGDVAGAETAMSSFARIAQATGSSVSDIATAAAAMQDATKLDPKQFEAVFSGLAAQGKAGAVNLKDMAGSLASLLPRFARFKDSLGADGVLQLGAAFQVARKGFGSAEEAATGLEGIMTALSKHSDRFEEAGVSIFNVGKDGTKTFRNLHDIVTDIGKSKLAKDPHLLTKAFGRAEAEATYNQLHRLSGVYDQMVTAGQDSGTVQRDLDTYMSSSSGKLEQAWTRIKNAITEAMTPERIQKFADAVSGLAEKIAPLVEGFGKIFGYMGSLYGAGQSIRGFMDGGKAKQYDENDIAMVANGYGEDMVTHGAMTQDEMLHRREAAKRNMANTDAYNASASDIMGGEVNDKSSPESIRRAFAAKYGDSTGAQQAGSKYISASGVSDPIEVANQQTRKISEYVDSANATKLVGSVVAAIRDGFAGVAVKVGAEPIQKAGANSINNRKQH